jgi:hypothetical protein
VVIDLRRVEKMIHTMQETGLWFEFVRLARVELILDQLENIFRGVDLPRSHWLWMIWEEACEENGRLLATLLDETAKYDVGGEVDWANVWRWGRGPAEALSPQQTSDGEEG